MEHISKLVNAMIEYFAGDPKRINHFIKVHAFAKLIGESEQLDEKTMNTLEVAALTHDIGIKICEEQYHTCSGKYQEIMGPDVARKMLSDLGYDNSLIDRVCFLIAHHHTYNNIQGIDYQILVEADFIVNIFEDNISCDSINNIKEKIFKTKTGTKYLKLMFLIPKEPPIIVE